MIEKRVPGSYSVYIDEKTGQETRVPNPTSTCFSYSTKEVEKWTEEGTIPKSLSDDFFSRMQEHADFMQEMQKRYGPKPTPKQILELHKERHTKKPKDWLKREVEHTVAFQEFLELNWEKLAKIIPKARNIRHSRGLIETSLQTKEPEIKCVSKPKIDLPELDLKEAELKLLHVLNQLLAEKSERYDQSSGDYYMGNYSPDGQTIERGLISFKDLERNVIQMETARLVITEYELIKRYYGDIKIGQSQRKQIRKTIESLENRLQPMIFLQAKETKKGVRYDRIRTKLPFFQLMILDENLTEQEYQSIDRESLGTTTDKAKLLFFMSPIFTNNIRYTYVEIPDDVLQKLAKTRTMGKRSSKTPGLVRACLLIFREKQVGRFKIERNEETLVRDFGLGKDWDSRRKKRAREYIERILNAFVEAGYVKTWKKSEGSRGQVKYTLHLTNPDIQQKIR